MTDPASCRLYLVSPKRIDHPAIFAAELRAAFDGGDVAAFLLSLPDADEADIVRAADTLRPICQQRDIAFFLDDRPALAVKLDCDGVQVSAEACVAARRVVGNERQVGVVCNASRHLAMEAAEAGADYVAFDLADLEMIEWWTGLFEIPCIATGNVTFATAPSLLKAGADFIAAGAAVWDAARGPQAAVRAFNELLSSNG